MKRSSLCKACSGPVSRTARTGLCAACYVTPIPADFAERALTTRKIALTREYGVGESVIERWYEASGLKPMSRLLPPPSDLAENAAQMGLCQLMRHYGNSQRTVRRWLDEAGLNAVYSPPRPREDYAPRASQQPPHRPAQFIWAGKRIPRVPGRDTSLAGLAAEHLRRLTPVYRCHERGAADPNGSHWRYGNAVLTEDEMFQRARRHGWEAVA